MTKALFTFIIILLVPQTYSQATARGQGGHARPTSEDKPGFTLALYLGGAHTSPSELRITQPGLNNRLSFEQVRFEGRSFNGPLYYGARVGIFPRRKSAIGAEAEFTHIKVYADPGQRVRVTGHNGGNPIDRLIALGDLVEQYSISHGVNLLLFNIVGRRAISRAQSSQGGRLILAGRFGLGPTIPHTESTIGGSHQEQYELGSLAWQVAGGVEIHLTRGLFLLAEYKFTRSKQKGRVNAGEAESLLRSHHGVIGLSYHF